MKVKNRRPAQKRRNPATEHGGRTDSDKALLKALESRVVRRAIIQVFHSISRSADLRSDILTIVANALGVQRSRLGAWESERGRNWITTDGIRAFLRYFEQSGNAAAAEKFKAEIISHHLDR